MNSLLNGSTSHLRLRQGSVRLLVMWSLPCFLLKTLREIRRMVHIQRESWWLSIYVLLVLIVSWTYVSTIYLSASILFNLVCNLQVIHFEDYGKLLETESDVLIFIEEHIRLRYYLSKISHRFRIFLLLQFFIVTASQFVTLFQTTGYSGIITILNGGDFAVSLLPALLVFLYSEKSFRLRTKFRSSIERTSICLLFLAMKNEK